MSITLHRLILLIVFVILLAFTPAYGQDNWLGGTGYWSNGNYWSTGLPPLSTDFVTIYSGGADLVTLDLGSVSITNLTLGGNYNGFSSELTDGGTTQNLTISGGLGVGPSGSLYFFGNYSSLNTDGFFNSGTFQTSAAITTHGFQNVGTLNNFGGIDSPDAGFGNEGTLNNFGGISCVHGGSGNSGTLNNYGDISLYDDNLGNGGPLNNYGTITMLDAPMSNYSILNNYGTVELISNDYYLTNYGTLKNYGLLLPSGLENVSTMDNYGTVRLVQLNSDNSGMLANAGILDIQTTFYNEGTLDNLGKLNTYDLWNYSVLNNRAGGTLNIYLENYPGYPGSLENYGTINNAGVVVIPPGSLLASDSSDYFGTGTYAQSAGSTIVDGTFSSVTPIHIDGGTLSGSGLIQGDVFMGGTMSPGDSPGLLTIQGNYTQLSSGSFFAELAGLTPGTQYDQLVVSGLATLDGTLDVVLLNGFVVHLGDSFVLMTFANETGQFSELDLPRLPHGEMWLLSYNPSNLTLQAAPTPEPASMLLLGSGLLSAALVFRRRNQ
ncbi:MAG TPA: PEP-CTERM sorting domain-containing protein [Candidatus Eisenbacteria bacterium]|nr:PEP-CTERM sorting domain-containing protein [Candidatus Eisenbacteria bacterium]